MNSNLFPEPDQCPSGLSNGHLEVIPLQRIDLSLCMPFGMWEKFKDRFSGTSQTAEDALAGLVSAYLFSEDVGEMLKG